MQTEVDKVWAHLSKHEKEAKSWVQDLVFAR
jgi:hypothetical protein